MIGMLVDEMYKILDELSRDDRGITYLARVLMTDEVVDIKFLKLTVEQMSGEARRRFQREMSLLGSLHDRHIVRLYKHGEYDGRHYMVFEHLAGISLRTVIELICQRRAAPIGCLDEERALRIARQVANGLSYAHEHKVIHRGLSPEAIMLGNDGLVKIVDFRFAKQPGSLDITLPGAVALKPTPLSGPRAAPRQGE